MACTDIDIKTWERAEIERSDVEAELTATLVSRDREANIARYLAPPCHTSFPRVYAFHLRGDVRSKTVLELGCGSGEYSHLLARRGAEVWSMDISESLIGLAKRRAVANQVSEAVSFFVGSAYEIPLSDELVDVVFGIAILHHLDLELASREVKRVLKRGGRAIFKEPVRNSKFIRGLRSLIPYQAPDVSPFERPLTDREMEDFAKGFSGYKSRPFLLPYTSAAGIIPVVRHRTDGLLHLDRYLLNHFPSLGYYAGIRVVEMIK
jgi:SAM-dependent methyltransferase